MTRGRSQLLTTGNFRDWHTVVRQILRRIQTNTEPTCAAMVKRLSRTTPKARAESTIGTVDVNTGTAWTVRRILSNYFDLLFCCRIGHRKTEPGGYFCRKLTLTRTPVPIRPTRRGPAPNRLTNGRKQGVLWPRGVCPGSFGRHRQ